jgi:hypothetical protein
MEKRMSSKLAGIACLACLVGVPFLLLACVVDSQSSSAGGFAGPSSGFSATGSSSGSEDGGTASAYPMTATVDTDQTMGAQPGQGVGVFATYDSGGSWNVWWTCDSAVDTANPPCAFDVKIAAQQGSITNLSSQGLAQNDTVTQTSASSIEGVTTTTTNAASVTFTTQAGAKIFLSATVGGQYDGRFVFFVEQGQIRDGYGGTVTDPIYLQPSNP